MASDLPSVSFVKRAVLQTDETGHAVDVEVDGTDGGKGTSTQVPLYEQLAKNIAERREQRVDGKPDELSIEDQEFVNRVLRQKDEEALQHEEEAKEFKRQRLLTAASSLAASSTSPREVVSGILSDTSKSGSLNASNNDESLPGIVVVRKKKKRIATTSSTSE